MGVDRAVALARGAVRERPDAWTPVLYMRLKSGRLWYEPGFRWTIGARFEGWPALLNHIDRGKCTPILGPGMTEALLGPRREIARALGRDLPLPHGAARSGGSAPGCPVRLGQPTRLALLLDELRDRARRDPERNRQRDPRGTAKARISERCCWSWPDGAGRPTGEPH